jgi:hypothetical protein
LQIPTSASPRLDFVDFIASRTAVSLTLAAELVKLSEVSAAVSAYRSLLTLGYCGFFCWPAVHSLFEQLTEQQLLECLRIAAYCNDLPADDARHIGLHHKSARQRFPVLFVIEEFSSGPDRSNYAGSLLAAMGSFAARHEFRAAGFPAVRRHDEDSYIAQWIGQSGQQIAEYLENPKFCAGLDAFGQDLLSFHGFLEKVFGRDYYDKVLAKNRYALFQGLRSDLTRRVIARLASQVRSGERPIAPDLRERFPELYAGYQPEFFGMRK